MDKFQRTGKVLIKHHYLKIKGRGVTWVKPVQLPSVWSRMTKSLICSSFNGARKRECHFCNVNLI